MLLFKNIYIIDQAAFCRVYAKPEHVALRHIKNGLRTEPGGSPLHVALTLSALLPLTKAHSLHSCSLLLRTIPYAERERGMWMKMSVLIKKKQLENRGRNDRDLFI